MAASFKRIYFAFSPVGRNADGEIEGDWFYQDFDDPHRGWLLVAALCEAVEAMAISTAKPFHDKPASIVLPKNNPRESEYLRWIKGEPQ